MFDFAPIIAISWFFYFLKNNRINNPMVGLIIISYVFFATNYSDLGLDLNIDIFRIIHRTIGVICILIFLIQVVTKRINIFQDWPSLTLSIFFVILLLSFLGNDIYLNHYLHYLRNFVFISLIVLFLNYQLDENAKIDEFFKLIGQSSIVLSIFVLIEVINHGWGNRFVLFFSNSNYLAVALLPGFTTLALSRVLRLEFLSILPLIAIFATGSRAVELAAVFVAMIFVIANFNRFNKKYLAISLLILVSASVIFFNKIVVKNHIDGTRFVIAKIVFNMYQDNPINGIGYGQFRTNYHKYIDEEILSLNNTEINDGFKSFRIDLSTEDLAFEGLNTKVEKMTHSDLFTVIAELGSIGILFLLFLFFKIFLEFKKLLMHSNYYFFNCFGLIGGSLIFSLLHNNMTAYIFWLVLFIPQLINKNYGRKLKP